MLNAKLMDIVDALLPALRQFVLGDYGIAVGGAHAKDQDDEESDLDIYLFNDAILPDEERTRLTQQTDATIHDIISWSSGMPFEQAGTDFYWGNLKVECWLRNARSIDGTVQDCLAGVVKRDLVVWTTTGFYNHCCLSDLQHMIPIADPAGMIQRWKSQVCHYPARLRSSIIDQHLGAARFWPANFHYSSAIERQDVIYTTGIIQQVLHNLIQVLFALNEVYFPGDKKLIQAISHFHHVPKHFTDRLQRLIFPADAISTGLLREQQRELQELLHEIEILAEENCA